MFYMTPKREESVWKSLASAFGDGLAFGVGAKLSHDATARVLPGRVEVRSLAERLLEMEQRIERARQNNALPGQFNQRMVEAVVAVVDNRLREQADRFERRLGEEMAALRGELSEQVALSRKHSDEANELLRQQMTTLHRQFAESLAKLVDEQIAATLDLRLAPLEMQLRDEIRQQAGRAAGLAAAAADEHITEKMQPMESALHDLSKRLEDNDRNTLELVLQLGHICLQTAERLSEPIMEPIAEVQVTPAPIVQDALPEPQLQPEMPAQGAAQGGGVDPLPPGSETSKVLWRAPLVSSFFVATTGLLLLHYL